jgi:hypothetical protein
MKKLITIILALTFIYINLYAPPNNADGPEKNYVDRATALYLQLVKVEKIRFTTRQKESRGNYDADGASGEIGAYQFMPGTYHNHCINYFGEYRPPTPHNQDTIAFCVIKDCVLNRGYTIDQVAAYWNSGDPDSRKSGINKAGVAYDVQAYVDDFRRRYDKIDSLWPKTTENYNLYRNHRTKSLTYATL